VTRAVLWDSSAVLALLDADDADHDHALTIAREIGRERGSSFITNYIEVEAHALLLQRLGRIAARQWLFANTLRVVHVTPAEEQRAREILLRYDDKDWSLCDAISFAVLESQSIPRAFSFDHHFRQYGRIHVLGLDR
jgi:predicted nucleic acid-binding protein